MSQLPVDLNTLSRDVIRKVYCALLRARDRLCDLDPDGGKTERTELDIDKLVEEYPWIREFARAYEFDGKPPWEK